MYRVPLLDISRLRTGTKTNFVSFANETTYEVQLWTLSVIECEIALP